MQLRRMFRALPLSFAIGAGAVTIAVAACGQPTPPPAPAAPAPDVSADHGRYLVDTHACHDCHTPAKMGPNGPEPDMSRMLSGHPETVKITAPPAMPAGGLWMSMSSATFTAWA